MSQQTAITTTSPEVELDVYGPRDQIRELTDRLIAMLPSVKQLGRQGAMALAQAALAMGLNPFIGEVWAIPQSKDGTAFAIMPGIKGIRRKAREQAREDRGYYTLNFRRPSDEEMEGLKLNPGDVIRACDMLYMGDRAQRLYEITKQIPKFTGLGRYRNGEATKMDPVQVARKRAEADALKQAFDIPLPILSSGEPDPHPSFDECSFEVPDVPDIYINGDYDHVAPGDGNEASAELFGAPIEHHTEPPPAKPKPRNWPATIIQAIIKAGYAENVQAAIGALNKSRGVTERDADDIILKWMSIYRQARAQNDPDKSAELADAALAIPKEA